MFLWLKEDEHALDADVVYEGRSSNLKNDGLDVYGVLRGHRG